MGGWREKSLETTLKKGKPSQFFCSSLFPQLRTKKVHLELNPVRSSRGQVRVYSNLAPKSLLPPSAPYLEGTATREGLNGSYRVLSRREEGRWRQVLTLVTPNAALHWNSDAEIDQMNTSLSLSTESTPSLSSAAGYLLLISLPFPSYLHPPSVHSI